VLCPDDMLGKVEHLALDLERRNVCESLLRGPDFVVVVQRAGDKAVLVRADEEGPKPAEEDGAGKSRDILFLQALADQRIDVDGRLVGGGEIVRTVEEKGIDVAAGNEGLQFERLVAFGNCRLDLVRLQNDVFVARHLITLDDILAVDVAAGIGVHHLPVDPVSRFAIDDVKAHPIRGRSGRIERDLATQFADLEVAFPVCTRSQNRTSLKALSTGGGGTLFRGYRSTRLRMN